MTTEISYSEDFNVGTYQVDAHLGMRLSCVLQWFSEVGWHHARLLGTDYENRSDSHKVWMLRGYNIEVYGRPHWQEAVTVETWYSGIDGVRYTREYKLWGSNGSCLIAASSSYVIYDLTLQKPVIDPNKSVLAVEGVPFAVAGGYERLRRHREAAFAKNIVPQYSEIDLHAHVNNAVYMRWIEDFVGDVFPKRIVSAKIQYVNEIRMGDEVAIYETCRDDTLCLDLCNGSHVYMLSEVVLR